MRKVELLPTRNCEAGYGPGSGYDNTSSLSLHDTIQPFPFVFGVFSKSYLKNTALICANLVKNS